ncbi:MAG TPA: ribosomal protein S18-alanine N-acetyltransferase [Gemmatimonadota bacterium]|nr:ribosomal protein S18-alanine N-acetyltransferase [Gemmatimonadota bacterium]
MSAGEATGGDPDLELRPCREADLDGILTIERRTFPTPWPRDQFAGLLGQPAGLGWVAAEPRGVVLGYAVGWVAVDEAELANLAVAEEWRGRGLGEGLVRAFAREAGVRGAGRLYLEVRVSNAGARRFYERLGFDLVGCRAGYYRSPREDALAFGVDLPLPA